MDPQENEATFRCGGPLVNVYQSWARNTHTNFVLEHRRYPLARARITSEGTNTRYLERYQTGNTGSRKVTSGTLKIEIIKAENEEPAAPILNGHPVQVNWQIAISCQTTGGRWILQLKSALGRERQQCWNRTEGGTGWQQCHNPAPRWTES